jgi:hypothetical protein
VELDDFDDCDKVQKKYNTNLNQSRSTINFNGTSIYAVFGMMGI